MNRLAAILRTRVALRQKRAKTGQLDAKATIRANLRHSGVPFDIRHRDKKKKPKLVVICDISTSMWHMSELMLSLIRAERVPARELERMSELIARARGGRKVGGAS